MKILDMLAARRTRKRAKEILHHARHVRHFREDLMSADELDGLTLRQEALLKATRGGSREEMERGGAELANHLSGLTPRRAFPAVRENIEVIVVAIAVAMAFRTYFIQPFKIPTGSMQPTLNGITSTDRAEPKLLDRLPFQPFRWIVTGELYRQLDVKKSGTLSLKMANSYAPYVNPNYPGDLYYQVMGKLYRIPRTSVDPRQGYKIRMSGLKPGDFVKAGTILWAGSRVAGDHVFVDKVSWNFRRPERGEIMVFSTRGIDALETTLPRDRKGKPMSTHYIKRMCGMPGDDLRIRWPNLVVNDDVVEEPETIARVSSARDGYAGYCSHVGNGNAEISYGTLGETEYYALGDNTRNSRDSRYWGPVPHDNLVGPACTVYWPFSKRWGRAR